MSLTRRNVATVGEANPRPTAGSIWEQEANEYWKKMEPARRYRRLSKYAACVVLALAAGGGTMLLARTVWQQRGALSMPALWLSHTSSDHPANAISPDSTTVNDVAAAVDAASPAVTSVAAPPAAPAAAPSDSPAPVPAPASAPATTEPATTEPAATEPAATAPAVTVPVNLIPVNPAFSINPAAADLLRARCRVRGVQTRWHEETCRKLCIRDPQNSACMNGCSYGSITVTKLTCDQVPASAVPTATQCPDSVSCSAACKVYDSETPYPDLRNSCERACANIVPSSCARILQIHRDLYQGMLQ